ncbi:hypothetical protein ACVWZZ_008621 [Bradyrhizobium sp. LM6.10]
MESKGLFRRIGDPFGRHHRRVREVLARTVSEYIGEFMRQRVFELRNAVLRQFAATLAVTSLLVMVGLGGASAQSGTPAPDQSKSAAQPADAAKDAAQNQRRTDEFAEAAQVISGPAGNPECVWLGRRVIRLMWRDDLDTAFRHLDLYDRFGCPGGHIQAAFRCLTRFGGQIDPKVAETLDSRVHACWINPALPAAAGGGRRGLAARRADIRQCATAAGREPLAGGKPVTGALEIAAIVSASVQERSAIEAIGTAAYSEICHALIRS